MNKIYKLVYSRTLNQVIAVSELATSAAVGKCVSPPDTNLSIEDRRSLVDSKRLGLAFALSSLFTALPMGAFAASSKSTERVGGLTAATATVDNDASLNKNLNYVSRSGYNSTNPGIAADPKSNTSDIKYVQNVPVVNIANPNAAGVSDNRFTKFSTDTGVVFNNNANGTISIKSSILAEKIAANPRLKKSAKTILTQITGNDKTLIKGVMEVLGNRADLIIVNPNGIDLNGISLVNVKDFTASTAEVGNNNAKKLNVKRGTINVTGDLSTDDVDIIRLIAKAVKLKSTIAPSSKDKKKANIVVSAGSQTYDLEREHVTSAKEKANAESKIAISGSVMGSMYGDQVNFIVTDSGAGIEYDGLVAGDDNIFITADGKVRVNQTYSKKSTYIKSKSGNVTAAEGGKISSQDKVKITAANVNLSDAIVHASNKIDIVATKNKAEVGTLVSNSVRLAAAKKVKTSKGSKILSNQARVYAKDEVDFEGRVYVNDKLAVQTREANSAYVTDSAKNSLEAALNTTINITPTEAAKASKVTFAGEVVVAGDTIVEADTINYVGNKTSNSTDTTLDFTFNNLTLSYDLDKLDSGVYLKQSNLVSNNIDLDYHTVEDVPTKAFINVEGGSYKVFQTTTIDLMKGNKDIVLNSQEKFDRINSLLGVLQSANTKVTVKSINIDKDTNITLDNAATFSTEYFINAGSLTTGNSLGIISRGKIDNSGILNVKGDLVLNSEESIVLNGMAKASNNALLIAPTISQEGSLTVTGDLGIYTNHYDLAARFGGKVEAKNQPLTYGESWHYTGLRKDHYEIYMDNIEIDTSDLYVSPAETTAGGNVTVQSYAAANHTDNTGGNDNSSSFGTTQVDVRNGRLYAQGSINVNGDLSVESKSFEINLMDVVKRPNKIKLVYTPITLIDTKLAMPTVYEFDSIYDLYEKLFSEENTLSSGPFYKMDRDYFMSALSSNSNLSPLLQYLNSKLFTSNWKNTTNSELNYRWTLFKLYPHKYSVAVFAPKAEVFAGSNVIQMNGNLTVGTPLEKNTRIVANSTTGVAEIKALDSRYALVARKINGLQTTSNYLLTLKKLINVARDGHVSMKRKNLLPLKAVDYEDISYLNLSDPFKNIGDDAVLAAIILEQIKDLGGASKATTDEVLRKTFLEIVESAKTYRRALTTIQFDSTLNKWTSEIELGSKQQFDSFEEAFKYINYNFDTINFIPDDSIKGGWHVPRLKLSEKTLSRLTNFDKVSASITGVDQVYTKENGETNVNYGSINSKAVRLDSKGDINLSSMVNQFAINANKSEITTEGNFTLQGNADFGSLSLQANDTKLIANSYLTDKGDFANQGIVKANFAKIITDTLHLDSTKLYASNDVYVKAKDLIMSVEENKASRNRTYAIEGAWSGREIGQVGNFIETSRIEGENVSLNIANNATITSSEIVAKENAEINVGNNLTLDTKGEVRYIAGRESKVTSTYNSQAQFGGYVTYAENVANLNYDMDGKVYITTIVGSRTDAPPTNNNAGLASISAGFVKETTLYYQTDAKQRNNLLDATNLVINVGNDAKLSGTDINTIGNGVNERNEVKSAEINAKNVIMDQADNKQIVKIHNEGWGISLTGYTTSSVADLGSYVTSIARSSRNNQQINPGYPAAIIGGVLGLVTRDSLAVGIKSSVGGHKNTAQLQDVYTNEAKIAGNLKIKADTENGKILLENINGNNLGNVSLEASEVEIKAGKSNIDKTVTSISSDVSVSFGAGIGVTGISTSGSLTAGGGKSRGRESSTQYLSSIISGANVDINASKLVVEGSNVNAAEELNINADTVKLKTLQDSYKSSKQNTYASATIGTTLSATPVPFTQLSYGETIHTEDRLSPSRVASITSAKNLNIDARHIENTAGTIAADSGTISVESLDTKDLYSFESIDGGGFNIAGGLNLNKNGTVNAGGYRDPSRDYRATVQATINFASTQSNREKLAQLGYEVTNQPVDLNVIESKTKGSNGENAGSTVATAVHQIISAEHQGKLPVTNPLATNDLDEVDPTGERSVENTTVETTPIVPTTPRKVGLNLILKPKSNLPLDFTPAETEAGEDINQAIAFKYNSDQYDQQTGKFKLNADVKKIISVQRSENYQGIPLSFSLSSTMINDVTNIFNRASYNVKEYISPGSGSTSSSASSSHTVVTEDPSTEIRINPTYVASRTGSEYAPAIAAGNAQPTTYSATPYSATTGSNAGTTGNTGNTNIANYRGHNILNTESYNLNNSVFNLGFSNYSTAASGNSNLGTYSHVNTVNQNFTSNSWNNYVNLIHSINAAKPSNVELTEEELAKLKAEYESGKYYIEGNKYLNLTKVTESDNSIYNISIGNSVNSNLANTVSRTFNNTSRLFSPVIDANSDSIVYYRPITQQFGSVFRQRDLNFDLESNFAENEKIQVVDLTSLRDNASTTVEGNNSNTEINIDRGDVDVNFGGDNGNNYNGGVANPDLPTTDGGNNLDLDVGNNSNYSNGDGPEFEGGVGPEIGDNGVTIPNVIIPVVEEGAGETSKPVIDNEGDGNSNPDIGSNNNPNPDTGTTTSPEQPTTEPEPSKPVDKPTSPVIDEPTIEEEKEVINTEDPKLDTEKEEKAEEATKEQEKPKEQEDKETPGDGNARSGDEIQLDESRKLTKIVVDDLTCYVLSKGNAASKDEEYGPNDYENYLKRNGLGSGRHTIFSIFSRSIVAALGDRGTICLPTGSELLKRDYNVAANRADTLKQITRNKLDVVVVYKKKAKAQQLVSNFVAPVKTTTKNTKVRFASFGNKASTAPTFDTSPIIEEKVIPITTGLEEIKRKLEIRGIDTSKLMILGSKIVPNDNSSKEKEELLVPLDTAQKYNTSIVNQGSTATVTPETNNETGNED